MHKNVYREVFSCNRREFLRWSAVVAAGLSFGPVRAAELVSAKTGNAKVAIVSCRDYGMELQTALARCFDFLGGISGLVKHKTVTIKVNLTGSSFKPTLGHSVGETYMTHPATAHALVTALFKAGARRVRFVESTNLHQPLEQTLQAAGWDVKALQAAGNVEFEDTRNLGRSRDYAEMKVPGTGYLFSQFEFNRSYADTDVMISLCKLKEHATTGVTLTMKNLFGITPNALYGDEAPGENATQGRGKLHDLKGFGPRQSTLPFDPPGAKEVFFVPGSGYQRVPRIITDICAARPIHLGIIDGITSTSGSEGPWIPELPMRFTTPGVLIAGLNPVATDAVGTAVMGFTNPRVSQGVAPFAKCENHLLLAEQAGLGTADLAKIEVIGQSIDTVRSRQYGQ
ncbi:MAG: DUF362 domain-containing protein [Kiritimatiellae bacterium]|nr:DUF362 domain-containing protein [Kiritimatiellia bacterium]MDD5520798.1 DUF362 domain-containing protein [Kiritimatiellia bacterium]